MALAGRVAHGILGAAAAPCPSRTARAPVAALALSRGFPRSAISAGGLARRPAGGSSVMGAHSPATRVRRASLSVQCRGEAAGATATSVADPAGRIVWELDFCSRPIVDERGKKVWELIVTDADRSFIHAEYFPNNKINSVTLKKSLGEVMEAQGIKPDKIRYFRSQMQTIISRALGELDIKPVPSRRCVTLMSVIEERLDSVYSQHPGYDPFAAPLVSLDKGSPEELPDALRGEMWTFTELPLSVVVEEASALGKTTSFGSAIDHVRTGVDLPPDTTIPGVVVFSRRAAPLAAWTNGLEVANLDADTDRDCLILETGVAARWRYGSWVKTPDAREESQLWNAAKKAAKGLHFLAVQDDPESETCAGFWLLYERDLPRI